MPVANPFRRSSARRSAGMKGIFSFLGGGALNEAPAGATSQPWYIPDAFYNVQGKNSPDQAYYDNTVLGAVPTSAMTNPITGQIVPAAQAYASTYRTAPAAAAQQAMAQPTGGTIADTFNSLFSSLVGTGSTPDPNAFPWGTVAIVAFAAAGGYLVYKIVVK